MEIGFSFTIRVSLDLFDVIKLRVSFAINVGLYVVRTCLSLCMCIHLINFVIVEAIKLQLSQS